MSGLILNEQIIFAPVLYSNSNQESTKWSNIKKPQMSLFEKTNTEKTQTKVQTKIKNEDELERKDYQKINNLVYFLPVGSNCGGSQEEIIKFITEYKNNPKKQAKIITRILEMSANGLGTYEEGMRAAVYSINKTTYPLVLNEFNTNMGCSIEEFLYSELGNEDLKDLLRHLNQFKK